MLYIYAHLDPRVCPLVFMVRYWAKLNGITNNNPGYWITNYPLTLLVIFFLQTRPHPVVPAPRQDCTLWWVSSTLTIHQLKTRRALLLYNVYGDSAFWLSTDNVFFFFIPTRANSAISHHNVFIPTISNCYMSQLLYRFESISECIIFGHKKTDVISLHFAYLICEDWDCTFKVLNFNTHVPDPYSI